MVTSISNIVQAIDTEISKLQQVRSLLSISNSGRTGIKRGPGRPAKFQAAPAQGKKRHLTPEGRKRIAAAMRRRWAARRAAAKKAA